MSDQKQNAATTDLSWLPKVAFNGLLVALVSEAPSFLLSIILLLTGLWFIPLLIPLIGSICAFVYGKYNIANSRYLYWALGFGQLVTFAVELWYFYAMVKNGASGLI